MKKLLLLIVLAFVLLFVWFLTYDDARAQDDTEPAVPAITSPRAEEVGDNLKVVWGGGPIESSSYSGKIVPVVIEMLEGVRLGGYEWIGPSDGTLMNAELVTHHPTHLAVGQQDLLGSLNGQPILDDDGQPSGMHYRFTVLQEDIADECLYLVGKSPHYQTIGHVVQNAWDVTIATGSAKSGSFGTLQILQEVYGDLGDVEVSHVGGAQDIVNAVLADEATFGFFVMRPDRNNEVFKIIDTQELTLVPIVDFDLEDLYEFKSLKVGGGEFHETACTSVQLITGDPASLPEDAGNRVTKRLDATIDRMTNQIEPAMFKQTVTEEFVTWRDYLDSVRAIGNDRLTTLLAASKEAMGEALN